MERLWAPWRMEYIRAPKTGECFICEAVAADPSRDREVLVLHRGELACVILNKYPYNNGHLMVAPARHEGEFGKLTGEELSEIMRLAQTSERIIRNEMRPDAFNIGLNLGRAAGCGLADHLHLHVVPRWTGDTNFMPVFADCHVIPQALEELWDLLRPRFEEETRRQGGGAE